MERELYKEERRERMMPRLTRKKPLYDNIVMSDPQGNVLATVSIKKAQWYVRKNLAQWNNSNNETTTAATQRPFGSSLHPIQHNN